MAFKTEQPHFLLVPLMSQSHIIPLTDFAKLLAQHGVFVSIITTPLNAIRYRGSIDNSRSRNLNIQTIPIEFPCKEAGLPQGCENLDGLESPESVAKFFRACEMLELPLEKLIQEIEPKPSCIVSTCAVSWTTNIARKFKIPRYIFETVSCFTMLCSRNLSRVLNVSESDCPDPFLVPDIPHDIEFTSAQLPKTMSKGSDFEEIKDHVKQALDSVQGTLVNSFRGLEPWYEEECRKERGKLWCIGPVSLSNKEFSDSSCRGNSSSINEHYCLSWLDSMKPRCVIYACFGSLCRISMQQIKQIGLGLEASGFAFIWVIRKQEGQSSEVEKWLEEERFQERVGGRGLVVRGWAPQVMILSHPCVGGFLTHCGWNSTLEGVTSGVPMITWPMFAEQFYNEKFIVDVLRIGVRVGVEGFVDSEKNEDLVTSDRVKNAIEEVMSESEEGCERRRRVEELAKMARNAVEVGGSSFWNVTMFIRDVLQQVHY